VAAAARQLRAAQPAWEALGPGGRARHMLAFLNWILDNEAGLVGIMQEESGKSWGDAALEVTDKVGKLRQGMDPDGSFTSDVGAMCTAGLLKFCRQQSVVAERIHLKTEPPWYPYAPGKSRFQARMIRFLGAHDWRRGLGRLPEG